MRIYENKRWAGRDAGSEREGGISYQSSSVLQYGTPLLSHQANWQSLVLSVLWKNRRVEQISPWRVGCSKMWAQRQRRLFFWISSHNILSHIIPSLDTVSENFIFKTPFSIQPAKCLKCWDMQSLLPPTPLIKQRGSKMI